MKKKVRITGLPTAKSGVEVKMDHLRAGLGFNSNVMPWPIMAGKMSAPPTKVNSKLQPIPREEANLEAEKDEVAMIPGQGSIPDTYTIGGKRHTQGGTPLNLPENSFIFSDTAKMRIKDPAVLAQFGLPPRKNGYTPAEIAKKYNTAPYKKILADKNTDRIQRESAELMLSNYNLKLAKLALIQESMKGFPQGIPEIAEPYLEAMQINPEDLMQQNPGAPENAEDAAGQESAMEIGGPVMAQQPGAPLQYLEEGGPDYFAMGGLKRYQTAGAVKEEPDRYIIKDILDGDNTDPNNPYDFYNLEQRIWDQNKSYSEPQVGKKAVEKLDKSIALINSYKETQPEVYKNLLPTLDRLIKSKQQFAEYGVLYGADKDAKNFGDPYVFPEMEGINIKPKDPNAIDSTNVPGFAPFTLPWQDVNTTEAVRKFGTNPETKDAMNVYMKAYKSDKPDVLEKAAKTIEAFGENTDISGLGWWPSSNQDKLQDLPEVLRERAIALEVAAKKKEKHDSYDIAQNKIKDILGHARVLYDKMPEGSTAKLRAYQAYQNALDKLTPIANKNREITHYDVTGKPMVIALGIDEKDEALINDMSKIFNTETTKALLRPTKSNKIVPPTVTQAGMQTVPTSTAATTNTVSFEDALKAMQKPVQKKFGGSTKKVRITGLPGMAYGGGLRKFQGDQDGSQYNNMSLYTGIPEDSPLMRPGVQLDFNNPNFATQAATSNNFSLDATKAPEQFKIRKESAIPADSPLNNPPAKLDFKSSNPTQPTQTQQPGAYKDTTVKWKQKSGIPGTVKAEGIMAGENFLTSIFNSKDAMALQKKIKGNQFELFTPTFGNKGSWSQSPSSYGMIDPNSNIVQQPGYMNLNRSLAGGLSSYGYPQHKFGGAMDQYKWGGLLKDAAGKTYAINDETGQTAYVTPQQYKQLIDAQNAAATSQAQPAATAPKKPATASTIGVYTPEWTKYLTDLAKKSGMSMDDPRFKAKLPAYFFDETTGKLKSQAELEKLTKAASSQKKTSSGTFGDEYWNDAYKPDFIKRHKDLIAKFEEEHPGEKFDPTKLDLNNGTESSHLKWFQEAYNKQAKELGAPEYNFGQANKLGRLTYSAPSLQDFTEPEKQKAAAAAAGTPAAGPAKTNLPDITKYQHLSQPRIDTPAFGWTMQDLGNVAHAVRSYLTTKRHMANNILPNFYQADTVFDDPTRRIAAINEQRNIGAQNMAGLTNPQAYMSNFLAGNSLGDVANVISDVHSRNINTANQRDMYNAQALNAYEADRANRINVTNDQNTLAQVAYEAEKAAKGDIANQMVNTGMKNAADIYNLNQMYPQFAVSPFLQTMYHKNPRALKTNYTQEKDLADVYNEILSSHSNLNDSPEGRKVALEAAKHKLKIASTPEDPYLEYQKSREQNQIPQVNPYAG